MSVYLEVDVCVECDTVPVPDVSNLSAWANAAYRSNEPASVCIKVVDHEESAALNAAYRQKSGPTNVLSFPLDEVIAPIDRLLGDIALCAPVIVAEAVTQHKPVDMHWAHMVIHGILHLQGYDHNDETDAAEMEQLEVDIMAGLGYKNPYEEADDGLNN